MKGIIFRGLEELILEKYGMSVWETMLENNIPPNRVYISAQSYPDEELFALVQQVAKTLDRPLTEILRMFGEFLFSYLIEKHQGILEQFKDFPSLVLGIDTVIHAEVSKLYHEPNLPQISSQQIDEKHIMMDYKSSRQLCFCAEGLIYGAAIYYDTEVHIEHQQCMHHGDEKCQLLIVFESKV